MIKTCPFCKKEFETYYTKKKFCSRQCLYESRRIIRKKVCPVCKKEFIAKKKNQIYCSIKCSSINQQSCFDLNNSKKRLHYIWSNMKTRCNNPKNIAYKDYGGRGIKVYDEWKDSFSSFYNWAIQNGYQNNLTLDRINVNGNYCPENCRWVTIYEQANNRRDNKYLTYNGNTLSIGAWANKVGLTWDILNWRLKTGWTVEEALFTPRMKNQIISYDGRKREEINLTEEKYKKLKGEQND